MFDCLGNASAYQLICGIHIVDVITYLTNIKINCSLSTHQANDCTYPFATQLDSQLPQFMSSQVRLH